MTEERFQELIGEIKDKFGIEEEYEEELENVPEGKVRGVIFSSPLGRVKLELTKTPAVVNKRTIYSKLQGSTSEVEYIYDLEDIVCSMKAYVDQAGEWQEMPKADFL